MASGNQNGFRIHLYGSDLTELIDSLYNQYNDKNWYYKKGEGYIEFSHNNWGVADYIWEIETPNNKSKVFKSVFKILEIIDKDTSKANKSNIEKSLDSCVVDWRIYDSSYERTRFYYYEVYKYQDGFSLYKKEKVKIPKDKFVEIRDFLYGDFEETYGKLEDETKTTQKQMKKLSKKKVDENSLAFKFARTISKEVSYISFDNQIFVHTTCKKEQMIEDYIVSKGGEVKNSTVVKTNYLIIGDGIEHETGKIKKAKELVEKGKDIKAMTENEFWNLVNKNE